MFFKRKKSVLVDVTSNYAMTREEVQQEIEEKKSLSTVAPPPINSQVIQKDLHQTFGQVMEAYLLKDIEQDKILKLEEQKQQLKDENKLIYDKAKKLKALNLSNTPTASASLRTLEARESRIQSNISKIENEMFALEQLKKYSEEYKLKYPTFKFVDDVTMKTIMKKYNLMMGEAFTYTKEIPDSSLEIISRFSEEIKESEKIITILKTSMYRGHTDFSIIEETLAENLEKVEKRRADYNFYRAHGIDKIPVRQFTISKFKMIAPESHFSIPTVSQENYMGEITKIPVGRFNSDNILKFDVKELEENQARIREVLDPIAVLKVDAGYIIMDAWDEEAEIPEIRNTFHN